MTRSRKMIAAIPAAHGGGVTACSNPQPFSSAYSAAPTAAAGNTRYTRKELKVVSTILLVQRVKRLCVKGRLGASFSQSAMDRNIPRKNPSRRGSALSMRNMFIGGIGRDSPAGLISVLSYCLRLLSAKA